jgi:TPR repeat protein
MSINRITSAKTSAVQALANSGNAAAQSELARRFARKRKYKEALRWFTTAARSGDPEHQMELGVVLFWDHAAHSAGIEWIRRAADQGHVGAQYFLGAELATGENIRKNVREAARWYRHAARRGHGEAQYNLALMYWTGEGVLRNPKTSHRWLEKAATSGDLLALRALSQAYETGQLGYRRNRVHARYWRKRYDRVNEAALKHVGQQGPREKS